MSEYLHIRSTTGGSWEVNDGARVEAHDTLRSALDSSLASIVASKGKDKNARLRDPDTGDLNGQWRWLSACEEEPRAIDGVRIDSTAIVEMAASLNARESPIVIDGGPTPPGMLASDVHGTPITGGGTPGNGWAHWAVPVIDETGRTELHLWSEVVPVVAREIDAGRIGAGSVHIRWKSLDGETPRGVELASFALTNDPAVTTLESSNAQRQMVRSYALRSARKGARSPRKESKMTTSKTTIAREFRKLALRGPALAKLTEIATQMGIDIEMEMSASEYESPMHKALADLKMLASAEKVMEALPASTPTATASAPEPTAQASFAARGPALDKMSAAAKMLGVEVAADATAESVQKALATALEDLVKVAAAEDIVERGTAMPPAPAVAEMAASANKRSGVRAVDGMSAEQETTVLTQWVEVLRSIFDKPEATAAELTDLLVASQDKIKGALSAPPSGDDADMGDGAVDAQMAAASAEATAEIEGLRSRIATLEAGNVRRAVAESVASALRKASATLAPDACALLVDDMLAAKDEAARSRTLDRAVRAAVGTPKTGTTLGAPSAASTIANAGVADLERLEAEAVRSVRAESPGMAGHLVVAAAQRRVRKSHPHLFGAGTSAD